MQTRWLIAYTYMRDEDVRAGDLRPRFENAISNVPPPEWLLAQILLAEKERNTPDCGWARSVTLLGSWPIPKKTTADKLYAKLI